MFKPNHIIFLKYPFSLLLSILTVSAMLAVYGFYWEISMKCAAVVIYGNITAPPYGVWCNDSLLFQIPVIAFLSDHFEKIPVFGIWNLISIVLYVSLWFHLSLRILKRLIENNLLTLILFSNLFVWSVIGISLDHVHVSRGSILLSSGSLLLYLDYYLFEKKRSIWLILLFSLGCLLRATTGVIVLMALTLFFLLHFRDFKKTVYLLKLHWLLAIICLSIVGIYKFTSKNPGVILEQHYEYALMDRHAVIPLSEMKSEVDTVRYLALTKYFLITDSALIDLNFIKNIVDSNKFLNLGINKEDFSNLSRTVSPLINKHKVTIFLFYLLLFIAAWNNSRNTVINMVVFHLFCWLVVIGFGMKINMFDRFLLPWISMIVGSSLLMCSFQKDKFKEWQKISVFLLLVILVIVVSGNLKNISEEERDYNKKTHSYLKNIESLSKTTIPVMWDYQQSYFPTDILSRNEADVFKNCIYETIFFDMYYEHGQKRCVEKLGFSPTDWRAMGVGFKENRDRIRFILEERTANFLELYYKVIYGIDFKLVKDFPVNEIAPGDFVFHLQAEKNPVQ